MKANISSTFFLLLAMNNILNSTITYESNDASVVIFVDCERTLTTRLFAQLAVPSDLATGSRGVMLRWIMSRVSNILLDLEHDPDH